MPIIKHNSGKTNIKQHTLHWHSLYLYINYFFLFSIEMSKSPNIKIVKSLVLLNCCRISWLNFSCTVFEIDQLIVLVENAFSLDYRLEWLLFVPKWYETNETNTHVLLVVCCSADLDCWLINTIRELCVCVVYASRLTLNISFAPFHRRKNRRAQRT